MAKDVRVTLGTAATAEALFDSIYALYRETFSKPPYRWPKDEDIQYRRRFLSMIKDPTFSIATAATNSQTLVGFAYGKVLRPDTHWWEGFTAPVSQEVTTEQENRTFAFIDFAVAESARGMGVGRQLHDTLLANRTEERATLAMEPNAHEVRRVYEHWGWTVVGRLRGPSTDFAPEFDIMVLPLLGR